MKKVVLSIGILSLFLASCGGGLESKVREYAKKSCECKSLKGDKADECIKELKKMDEELDKAKKEAKLKPSEKDKLEWVAKDEKFLCNEDKEDTKEGEGGEDTDK